MLGTYHLTVLYNILKELHFMYQSDKIYNYLLEILSNSLDSDAASFFTVDAQKGSLVLRACIGPKKNMVELIADELPFPYGKGICGWVAQYNQGVIVDNVQTDQRFNQQVDTLTGYKTKSVLCAPVANRDEVIGVIEILNKKSSAFNKNDLDLLMIIAKQAGIALENARLYHELEASRNLNESVLANLTGGFLAVDPKWTITHMNGVAATILGLSAQECVGKSCSDALKNYPQILKEIVDTLTSKENKIRQEIECQRRDKSVIRVGYSTFLIEDRAKKFLGAGIIFQNLSQFQ